MIHAGEVTLGRRGKAVERTKAAKTPCRSNKAAGQERVRCVAENKERGKKHTSFLQKGKPLNCCSSPALFGNSARLSELSEYYRPRWRRCAPSTSCSFGNRSPCTSSIMQGLQKSATLPLAKKVLYVTRPASRSHPGMFAVPVARRHRIPFSL